MGGKGEGFTGTIIKGTWTTTRGGGTGGGRQGGRVWRGWGKGWGKRQKTT